MADPPIFKVPVAVVEIRMSGDPFATPWHFEIRRPDYPPYRTECLVLLETLTNGDPHLKIHWKGDHHTPEIRMILEKAMSKRLKDILGDEWTLHGAPELVEPVDGN